MERRSGSERDLAVGLAERGMRGMEDAMVIGCKG